MSKEFLISHFNNLIKCLNQIMCYLSIIVFFIYYNIFVYFIGNHFGNNWKYDL